MSKGGLIIRLIDVVLILLLGFIGISDFTIKTQIKLPQGAEQTSTPIRKMQVVRIQIDKKNNYEINSSDSHFNTLNDIYEVEKEIERRLNVNPDLIVIIEPHLDTIIQRTVDLIDICEKYQIPKSINYEL